MINKYIQESGTKKISNDQQKTAKPPINQLDKQKGEPKQQKNTITSKTQSDLTLKEIQNDSSTQQIQPKQGSQVKISAAGDLSKKTQRSESYNKKAQLKRSDISTDASRSQYSSNSNIPQLSMLKKSQVSVYGSEAGIKPITKNPWAPIKIGDDNKTTKSLKSIKQPNLKSQSPQNSKRILKGIQNNIKTTHLELKDKIAQKDTSIIGNQFQLKKIMNQGINFGTFSQFSQKYLESQYQFPSQKNEEQNDLLTIRKISNISEQLQVNQKRKIVKEIELLKLQYNLFLNDESLKEKLLLTQKLNDFLQSSQNLNQLYDQVLNVKQENGNYVRINFEGRSIFLDILKSQASFSSQLQTNSEILPQQIDRQDLISIQDKRKAIISQLCLWDNPKNIFQLENQISQIEKIDNFIQYLENLYQDLNKQFLNVLKNQQFL
ncbi:hypothetical protein ABPG72_002178 [Tetrahymena utriculariae]